MEWNRHIIEVCQCASTSKELTKSDAEALLPESPVQTQRASKALKKMTMKENQRVSKGHSLY